jgi:Collagen triple helix repeat (20 copies)
MRRLPNKLTYSKVVSTLCLFLLLGGVAYAAIKIPKNSIGTSQLKNEAVTAAKVKSGSLLANNFAAGQLPAGAQGPKGDTGKEGPGGREGLPGEPGKQGEKGERGETGAKGSQGEPGLKGDNGERGEKGETGLKGEKGERGEKGEPGSLVTTLPSGQTLKGVYSYAGFYKEGFRPTDAISYQIPLASRPTANIVGVSSPPTTPCPGSATNPEAEPGDLCLYQTKNSSGTELEVLFEANGKYGATLFALIPEGKSFEFDGSWAVTAP